MDLQEPEKTDVSRQPDTQQTLERPAICAGIGVHSGEKARLVIKPALPGTGIVFCRTDVKDVDPFVPANAEAVSDTRLCTRIANDAGTSVSVVEHLMAAFSGIGIDNALVEIDGPEVPIMDGSSSVFCELLLEAGLKAQSVARRRIRILDTVEVVDGPKRASLSPSDDNILTLRARIEYTDDIIGVQQMAMRMAPGMFARNLAFARTYGFARDVDMLRSMGLARGGSLENAVVLDGDTVMNPEGLRAEDEFVRHKMLDAVGDLALAGGPIAGHYDAVQPGHAINNALVRKLIATPSAWCWESDTLPTQNRKAVESVTL